MSSIQIRRFIPILIGGLFDLIDLVLTAAAPFTLGGSLLLSAIIDVVAAFYFFTILRVGRAQRLAVIGSATFIEIIPGIGILPTWTLVGLIVARRTKGKGASL